MAEIIEGGCYKDATGDGYHDANGNPVPASKVAEANRVKQPAGNPLAAIVVPPLVERTEPPPQVSSNQLAAGFPRTRKQP